MTAIYCCTSCFSPSAQVVTMRVGDTWGLNHRERINLCARCRIGVWNPWVHIKALDGVSL